MFTNLKQKIEGELGQRLVSTRPKVNPDQVRAFTERKLVHKLRQIRVEREGGGDAPLNNPNQKSENTNSDSGSEYGGFEAANMIGFSECSSRDGGAESNLCQRFEDPLDSYKKLQFQNQMLSNENKDLKKRLAKYETEMSEFKVTLSSAYRTLERLGAENAELKRNESAWQHWKVEDYNRLKSERNRLAEDVEALLEGREELLCKVQSLQEELKRKEQDITELLNHLDQSDHIDELESEFLERSQVSDGTTKEEEDDEFYDILPNPSDEEIDIGPRAQFVINGDFKKYYQLSFAELDKEEEEK